MYNGRLAAGFLGKYIPIFGAKCIVIRAHQIGWKFLNDSSSVNIGNRNRVYSHYFPFFLYYFRLSD